MSYKTQFTKIGKVIKNEINNQKINEAFLRHQVLKAWERTAVSFFKEAEKLTKALDFKKGVLTVACLDEKLAYQLKILASRIIYAVNNFLGKILVYSLRVES